jgi:mRNA-degrading endonuclease toxin of MazEF toxin-antitoxin module
MGARERGLLREGATRCGHPHTMDKKSLTRRVGQLTAARLAEIDRALRRSLALT